MIKIRIAEQNAGDRRMPRPGRRLGPEPNQLRPEVWRGIHQYPSAFVGRDGNTALGSRLEEAAPGRLALTAGTIPLGNSAAGSRSQYFNDHDYGNRTAANKSQAGIATLSGLAERGVPLLRDGRTVMMDYRIKGSSSFSANA
jgi:hypothetical protein